MLKCYLLASHNGKQNRKTSSCSIFIAAFVQADGRKIMDSFLDQIVISQPMLKIMN